MTSGVSVCSTHEALMKKSAFHYDTELPDLMSDTFYKIYFLNIINEQVKELID